MNKQELATKIWATANELRKNIKASEYKDYIRIASILHFSSAGETGITIS